jgi:hypothetical protein
MRPTDPVLEARELRARMQRAAARARELVRELELETDGLREETGVKPVDLEKPGDGDEH